MLGLCVGKGVCGEGGGDGEVAGILCPTESKGYAKTSLVRRYLKGVCQIII